MSQKILVFGQAQASFVFKTSFDLKTLNKSHLLADDYYFEVTGNGFEVAKILSQKHQVSFYTELGDDFLAEQIVHQLNQANVSLDYIQSANLSTNCVVKLDNKVSRQISVLESAQTKLNINSYDFADFDYFVIADNLLGLEQLDQLLHYARAHQTKVIYCLNQPVVSEKLIYLLDDVDLLVTDQKLLQKISHQKDLELALKWLEQQVENFVIKTAESCQIKFGSTVFEITNLEAKDLAVRQIVLAYLAGGELADDLARILPKQAVINERSV